MTEAELKRINDLVAGIPDDKIIELVLSLGAERYEENNHCIIFNTICHNVHGGSMKLYYYKKNKLFHCYTDCDCSFNIIKLFVKRYDLIGKKYNFYEDVFKVVEGSSTVKISSSDFNKQEVYESIIAKYAKDETVVDIPHYSENLLNAFEDIPPIEWLQEGINEDTLKTYKIRYSISQNKIIIPHYDIDNNLIGIRGRALNPEDIVMGKYMPVMIEGKLYVHPLMFNLYGINVVKENLKKFKVAIIAEGEKSPMLMNSMYPDRNICVASCGSSIHKYQINLLRDLGVERIIVAYDNEGKTWREKDEYYYKLKNICLKYKNLCQMGFLFDNENLLELKDSPFDRGKEVFEKIMKKVVTV